MNTVVGPMSRTSLIASSRASFCGSATGDVDNDNDSWSSPCLSKTAGSVGDDLPNR
jgi:hypothetical protein